MQQRAISPKIKWKDVDNGIFLLMGDKKNKSLIVKIKQSDLGFTVGLSYAWKHYLYLKKLYEITKDESIEKWVVSAKSYINLVEYETKDTVEIKKLILPQQTTPLAMFSLTSEGLVAQHFATKETKFINHSYDYKSKVSKPGCSPYFAYLQAIGLWKQLFDKNFKTEVFLKENMKEYFKDYKWISKKNLKEINKIKVQMLINMIYPTEVLHLLINAKTFGLKRFQIKHIS